jgi:hypothetical protein
MYTLRVWRDFRGIWVFQVNDGPTYIREMAFNILGTQELGYMARINTSEAVSKSMKISRIFCSMRTRPVGAYGI